MSDRHAKSGEDMMEVLAHDITRYETLPEQSYLFALASALAWNAPNDRVECWMEIYVELSLFLGKMKD
jgi:hypothetical protein